MADIIGFGGDGTYVALGRGDGTFGDTTRMVDSFRQSDAGGGWSSNDRFPRFVADIDGDGLADLVGFGGAGAYVARASVGWVRQSGQEGQSGAGDHLPDWAEVFAGAEAAPDPRGPLPLPVEMAAVVEHAAMHAF